MERINLTQANTNSALLAKVTRESGQDISACYQCGKCTAGCLMAGAGDGGPRLVMRLLQFGLLDQVLSGKAIWLCAACGICTVRCPREIDVAKVMESLRRMARQTGQRPAEPAVAAFEDLFLTCVSRHGRMHELGVMVAHNIKTGRPFKDADLGQKLFFRGKLRLLPSRVRKVAAVKQLFARTGGGAA